MVNYQLYLGISSRSFHNLTEKEKSFIDYFTKVNMNAISKVMDELYTTGPKGYGSSLILARMVKIKERFPNNMRKGIILIADSTFLLTAGSTKGIKKEDGSWLFKDQGAAFGRPHHKHKYPVGYKAHSLITINCIPLVSLLSSADEHDTDYIFPLLKELKQRYPTLTFSYIILDRGYDSEEIHRGIHENFGVIPVIIRNKMVYPRGFTSEGFPLCSFNYPMKRKGIDYRYKRTQYACDKVCQRAKQHPLFDCKFLHCTSRSDYTHYTYCTHSYRKFGPILPNSILSKRLKPFRTGIERTYALVKENRYRMETSTT